MPIYPVKNSKTGEEQTLNMTIANYEQWRKDNPDWDKDWSKGCASAQEVGDWQNKLISRNPGWNDVLGKAAKAPANYRHSSYPALIHEAPVPEMLSANDIYEAIGSRDPVPSLKQYVEEDEVEGSPLDHRLDQPAICNATAPSGNVPV
jgi:hypothetical protein